MDNQELQQKVEALEIALRELIQIIIGTDRALSGAVKTGLRDAANALPAGATRDTIEQFLVLPE